MAIFTYPKKATGYLPKPIILNAAIAAKVDAGIAPTAMIPKQIANSSSQVFGMIIDFSISDKKINV